MIWREMLCGKCANIDSYTFFRWKCGLRFIFYHRKNFTKKQKTRYCFFSSFGIFVVVVVVGCPSIYFFLFLSVLLTNTVCIYIITVIIFVRISYLSTLHHTVYVCWFNPWHYFSYVLVFFFRFAAVVVARLFLFLLDALIAWIDLFSVTCVFILLLLNFAFLLNEQHTHIESEKYTYE